MNDPIAPYRQHYAALTNDDAGDEPDFIRCAAQIREWRVSKHLGIPRRQQEDWRFTDLSGFAAQPFARSATVPVAADRVAPPLVDEGPRLVFVNGRLNLALSRQGELSAGAIITSLAQAKSEHSDLVAAHLGQLAGLTDNAFCALNDALFEDGAFIYLPGGYTVEQPIELVYWNDAGSAHTAAYLRNLIVLENASQATVVESYQGAEAYFCCPQTECRLAQDAVLSLHKLQQESSQAYHLGGLRLQLAAGSQARLHLLSAGGKLNRSDLYVRMDGPGADCSIDGLSLLQDGELSDYHLQVEHAQPQGSSRQLFKSVLDGKSRAVFDSLIKVVKDAQLTNASQTCRNLLLSKRALAHVNPRLEILADDVKCAHGATVGFLDPDALFYLRARGISEAQARAMLIYAFANEQIERIALTPLRERLEQLLYARFHPEDAAS